MLRMQSYLKPQELHGLNKFLHCFPTAMTYTMTNLLGKSETASPFPRHKENFYVMAIGKFYPDIYPAQVRMNFHFQKYLL